MKTKTIALGMAAALACAAAVPASAATTIINFEKTPFEFTTYTESGVTFTAGGQTIRAGNGTPNRTKALIATGTPASPITATFASLFSGTISIDLGDLGVDADNLGLAIFNKNNKLLDSVSLLTTSTDTTMHTLTLTGKNIAYVVFGSTAPSVGGSSVYADNFTFTPTATGAVPEPATWAMMLLGFGAVGGAMRRRTKVAARIRFA